MVSGDGRFISRSGTPLGVLTFGRAMVDFGEFVMEKVIFFVSGIEWV